MGNIISYFFPIINFGKKIKKDLNIKQDSEFQNYLKIYCNYEEEIEEGRLTIKL